MTLPQRIQLRRIKGWRKPEGCIVVARPSRWGNPFAVGEPIEPASDLWPYLRTPEDRFAPRLDDDLPRAVAVGTLGSSSLTVIDAARAVEVYAWWIIEQPELMLTLDELSGHDLACWCPLDQPCHADVLLELANQ